MRVVTQKVILAVGQESVKVAVHSVGVFVNGILDVVLLPVEGGVLFPVNTLYFAIAMSRLIRHQDAPTARGNVRPSEIEGRG